MPPVRTPAWRVHGYLWIVVGSLLLLAALSLGIRSVTAATLAVFGIGGLDIVTGTMAPRRRHAGRWWLIATVIAHLALAVRLWHDAQCLAASVQAPPSTPMTQHQMIERAAGGAMLGMIVLFEECLAVASALLSAGTAVALTRSRS